MLNIYFHLCFQSFSICNAMLSIRLCDKFDQDWRMSQQQVRTAYKADYSFYRGYVAYRHGYRKAIVIHIIEIIMLAVLLPIDITILTAGNKMITALGIALADSVVSLLITLYLYSILFVRAPIRYYCILASDAHHITNQPINNMDTIEDCTSQDVLHAATGTPLEGMNEQFVNIYGNIACGEIEQISEYRFPQMSCCGKLYHFLALGTMLIVIIFLSTSGNPNPAQITILVVFLVLEAYLKLKIIIIMALIALSPLICIFIICYVCCCKREEGPMKMDLQAKAAETDDIVKSGGDCAICLMNIKMGEPIYQLRCSDKHIFHEGCLNNWSRVKPNCPVCRADLPMVQSNQPPVQIQANEVQ